MLKCKPTLFAHTVEPRFEGKGRGPKGRGRKGRKGKGEDERMDKGRGREGGMGIAHPLF